MKKLVFWIVTIFTAFMGVHNSAAPSGNLNSQGKSFRSLCGDDDPIVMHAHVRTSGGLAISGGTVSLTLFGTDTPQYSGTTDSNGDFTFDAVDQGNYHYKITASGYVTKNVGLSLHVNTDRTDTLTAI